MSFSRRDVIKGSLGAAAFLATGARFSGLSFAAADKKIPIGLQLYSVRKQCEKDLPAVIEAVAKMGYQGVEFAGYYNRSAADLRKLLDGAGLKCCGTHTGFPTILPEQLDQTIEFNRTLGNKYLIVPGLPKKQTESKEALVQTAKILTDAAAKASKAGMVVGYHAHGPDFLKFDGQTHWEILFDNAGPNVVMQMDVGNCLGGGGDPYAMLKKYPGRSLTIHLKEHGGKKGAPVGEGDVNWKQVFELCETVGKTEWYIVEHESGDNPLEAVAQCLKNLRAMGK